MKFLTIICIILIPKFCFGTVDPGKMAEAEVNSWKAYYSKDVTGIFSNLQTMIGFQYEIKNQALLRHVSFQLSLAIAKFGELPESTTRKDYQQQVLPMLVEGYKSLKDATNSAWNPETVAGYDLDWWIARRSYKTNRADNVAKVMTELYQTLYGKNDNFYFSRAGYLHASAAQYRDLCKRNWSPFKETDWQVIQSLLKEAYEQLVLGIQNNEAHQVIKDKK